jgi:hypothetical protein
MVLSPSRPNDITVERQQACFPDAKPFAGRRARILKDSILVGIMLLCGLFFYGPPRVSAATDSGSMTEEEASSLGEEFGIVVGAVDEEIQKELKLQQAQGVAVFEVIGNSRADYAGIKVRSVIKEIDKQEIRNMADFGQALKKAMTGCNFTVGTYEPAEPGEPVSWGVNFHFVGCKRD